MPVWIGFLEGVDSNGDVSDYGTDWFPEYSI